MIDGKPNETVQGMVSDKETRESENLVGKEPKPS